MKELYPYYIKYKQILIPSSFLLLSIFLIFAVIMPQIGVISETNRGISEANEKITTLKNSLSVVESANPTQTQDNLQTVTTALPTAKDIALIFNALSETANKSGVGLDEFALKVGGIYGKAEKVDTEGVAGVPAIEVDAKTTGDAQSTVVFSQNLQKALPLSEIKLIDMTDDQAKYTINFFYKPLDLSVLMQNVVTPLNQTDVNLINQLRGWEQ